MNQTGNLQRSGKRVAREELYEAVWSKTLKALAHEWNTTYVQLVKACNDLDVPRPEPGHWPMMARGFVTKKEPLPELNTGVPADVVLVGPSVDDRNRESTRAGGAKAHRQAFGPAKVPGKKEEVSASGVVPEESLAERLSKAAEEAVLDIVRQAIRTDFWPDSVSRTFGPGELAGWLKVKDSVEVAEVELRRTVSGVRREYGSFTVKVEEKKDETGRTWVTVEVGLREGAEWKDAWEEAWTFAEDPNAHGLSDNALRLYTWAKGPKNTGALMERRIIGLQARLVKTYNDMEDHLREIRQKADSTIQWEVVGGVWQAQFRIWFEKVTEKFYDYGPLNPALGLDLLRGDWNQMERFRNWLYKEIMEPEFPDGTESVGVFEIRSRQVLKRAFSRLPGETGSYGPLPGFFGAVRLLDGLELRRTFDNGAGPWLVVCRVQKGVTWKEIKSKLAARASEIPLEKRYNLSSDGLALLKWILDLRKEEYLLGMTPVVEDRLRNDVGIETDLVRENARAYLELLVEEINGGTEFHLRTVTWRHYAREGTRILVKKKGTGLEEIVRGVQVLALAENKVVGADKVRERILDLIREG